MSSTAHMIEGNQVRPDGYFCAYPPPEIWHCRRCRSEIDKESVICTVHEGLYAFYHLRCVDAADPLHSENQAA